MVEYEFHAGGFLWAASLISAANLSGYLTSRIDGVSVTSITDQHHTRKAWRDSKGKAPRPQTAIDWAARNMGAGYNGVLATTVSRKAYSMKPDSGAHLI
jgi:hypothetical protein